MRKNIEWGVKWAAVFAGAYSAWALLLYVARGPAAFLQYNSNLGQVLLLYWCGGILAGVAIGLCKPLESSNLGAAAVGALASIPFTVGERIMLRGFSAWHPHDTAFVIIFPLVFGAPAGLILHSIFAGER